MSELGKLVGELRSLRLRPDDWDEIDRLLAELESGCDVDEELSQRVFEARVRGRFSGPRAAGDVVPTKQTSVLPVVGLICGGLLVAVGALLGGGWILAGIVLLGLFVFGVAFAGSRVAHRGAVGAHEERVEPVPIPDWVALRVNQLTRQA